LKKGKYRPNAEPEMIHPDITTFDSYIKPDSDSLNWWDLFIVRQTNTKLHLIGDNVHSVRRYEYERHLKRNSR